jgi:hypothetical protein
MDRDCTLTKSDVISFNTRSNLNIVFNSRRLKNLSNDQFVKLTTIFLGLPPTHSIGAAVQVEGFDYPVESCMTVHGVHTSPCLDANADHHSGSCPSATLAVSRRHTNLTAVIIKFATEAGAIARREPPTHTLFQGFLSQAQCSKIFPKKISASYKKKASEILHLISQSSVDESQVQALYAELPQLDPNNSAALRLDISILNPTNQKAYLLDGSFIHTSCAAYRDSEFNGISKRLDSADVAVKKNATDPMLWEPSTTIAAKAKLKTDKYAPLMQIMRFLERDQRIEESHSFVPFIVSSRGEFSKEAYSFIEMIVSLYKFRLTKCPELAFPLPLYRAVHDFRTRFNLELMRVAAIGLANIACTAGKPFGKRSIYAVH